MCYFKRVAWACGCLLGSVPARPCRYEGTPDCRRRHLLDRIRIPTKCRRHSPQTSPSPGIRRRHSPGSQRRRQGLTLRRRSNSGSSGSTGTP
ncbi:hypothetical protein BT67DRAFT_440169 [Trichocladium antarcticum]|uniref:Secreted protein n=1 Tax=Trichocladium antarcticum TaxID=1450529 RepID=A0AAN6UMZ8_9PEZI|nr:hypothetical protein BT67DRAFT_440169 [Trichocladium antarcticum]